MTRKSIPRGDNDKYNRVQSKELFIIKEKKPFKVEDFLPDYSFSYEHLETDDEALAMSKSLNEFIKANEEITLDGYSSKDMNAVIEGYNRAIAVTELFFKSLYLDLNYNDSKGDSDEKG